MTHHPATSLLLGARHQRLGQLCEICCNVQRPRETERRPAKLEFLNKQREDRDLQEILDLIFGDSQLNVYGGELEVRPPADGLYGGILWTERRIPRPFATRAE
jgi:hypothetical protein